MSFFKDKDGNDLKEPTEVELLKMTIGLQNWGTEMEVAKKKNQQFWFRSLHRKEKRRILAKNTFEHEYSMWCTERDIKAFENGTGGPP